MSLAERKNEVPKRPDDFDPLGMVDIGMKMVEGRRVTTRERSVLGEFLQSRSRDQTTATFEIPQE
ncbi:hypothetical protein A2696_01645 [Candidatus Curtissbacteria bacterium RIFCSPHIGHO2_01_FULL_41_13]|uniref:Uncharacterized protein n=1 Tax=Candidatus Curtissbacteria bacterium RIFCSPHIGHO2_01_FULL_41_13 TaxID=1797745 RepID=A0A1F5FXV6_9BACT|nr:MAG: hypothetical protein A2696_01645 [Candidatus Curtissbacteria bacterium RIFCSPHIGHO2_01_FULL_41_13]